MKKLFLSMMLLALPLLASAYDAEVDGIYYKLNSSTKEAVVTYKDNNYNSYTGSVDIPEEFTYGGVKYSVAGIGSNAFQNCSGLTSVTIPNSLSKIGQYAFSGCSSLMSIIIPNTVTIIDGYVFNGCRGLKNITIPNSVKSIAGNAFYGCSGLTSITIPNSVTKIGSSAFNDCTGLTSLDIPNSVTSIGYFAFGNCNSLTSITIPNSVTSIGENAFVMCNGLKKVIVKDIAAWCAIKFSNYSSNPLSFAHHLFSDENTEITDLIIPNYVTKIGSYAFSGCNGLTSVIIPKSVTSIGVAAFYGCHDLTSVSIPNSITAIGISVFSSCSSLTSVSIPNSVTSIGEGAFADCISLSSITIPKAVISIGTYAFSGCTSLISVISKLEHPCPIDLYCFENEVYNIATLYVPKGSLDKYLSTDCWYKFINKQEGNPFEHDLIYIIDGVIFKSDSFKEGDLITPEILPTKEGYTFSGWSDIPSTMPDHDVTVTGSFTINKYKLTYMVDGENYMSSDVEFGAAITPEANPTKEGYTFSGWSEIPKIMPASDVTITGTFTANKYKLTYLVDGENYMSSDVEFGTAITPETVPTKEGYTFSGWSEIPSTMPANDVTVTGMFIINKYTITYMIDGEVFKSMEVEYNSAITPPDAPAQEGYSFAWADVPETMPARDITIYGVYTTGINALTNEEDERQVFTPDGKRVETPKKGMNIIRRRDGTVKKVIVK